MVTKYYFITTVVYFFRIWTRSALLEAINILRRIICSVELRKFIPNEQLQVERCLLDLFYCCRTATVSLLLAKPHSQNGYKTDSIT